MLLGSSELTEKVQNNTKRFRDAMTNAGFTIAGMDHPIAPVMLGDARLANVFADEMLSKSNKQLTAWFNEITENTILERGIYVIGFSYPVVPKGKARIRVQISAAHSESEIDECVAAFIEVGKKMNVI